MDRRAILAGLILSAAGASNARSLEPVKRSLGWLTFTGAGEADFIADTMAALSKLGWDRGKNVRLSRSIPLNPTDIDASVDELVGLRPDLLVVNGEGAASAVVARARSQPLMFYNGYDPVGAGLVQSLARPGGSVTGLVGFPLSLGPRWVDLLRSLVPGLRRLAIVHEPSIPAGARMHDGIAAFARGLDIEVNSWPAADFGLVERLMRDFAGPVPAAAIVIPDPITFRIRRDLTQVAHQTRLPAMFWYSDAVKANALVSYGPVRADMLSTLASSIDRTLRGVPSSRLPVEEPVRYELAINRFIAEQFGLTIPHLLAAQADVLVE